MSTSLLLGWGAFARDKNTSARLCANNAGGGGGGGGGLMRVGGGGGGGAHLRDTTVLRFSRGNEDTIVD